MKKFRFNKILVFIAILLLSNSTFSQDIGFGDNVVDNNPPASPIDSNIYLVLFIGIVYALFIINSRKQKVESN